MGYYDYFIFFLSSYFLTHILVQLDLCRPCMWIQFLFFSFIDIIYLCIKLNISLHSSCSFIFNTRNWCTWGLILSSISMNVIIILYIYKVWFLFQIVCYLYLIFFILSYLWHWKFIRLKKNGKPDYLFYFKWFLTIENCK